MILFANIQAFIYRGWEVGGEGGEGRGGAGSGGSVGGSQYILHS